MRVIKQQKRNLLSVVKRFKATDTTADKTIPCRRKSVCVKKVAEAVKKRISRNPRRSRISPVLVPPQSRQISGLSSRLRAGTSDFVHVVEIGILLRMMFCVSPGSREIVRSVLRLRHSVIA